MKQLLSYLKQYKKECILGPLFKLLEALFELLVPLVMTSIIDVGIRYGDREYILQRCGILVLLAVVGLVCSITAQYFAAKAATGFSARLRSALFSHVQSLSYSEIDTLGSATMITRMTCESAAERGESCPAFAAQISLCGFWRDAHGLYH